MLTTRETVEQIRFGGEPVLCLDTCAVLDVVRDPTRKKFGGAQVRAAMELLSWVESAPRGLSLVTSATVGMEIDAHLKDVEEESFRILKALDERTLRAASIFEAIGVSISGVPKLAELGFPVRARKVVERFVRAAHLVEDESVSKARAMDRVSRGVAPATLAKQSAKDCLIVETYLYLARELRAAGFGEKIVFLTTNTRDFTADQRSSRLHGDLVGDFESTGMIFATSFLSARYAF